MVNVALSYAMDGTDIANAISSEFKNKKQSWKINHYPLIGSSVNSDFWRTICNGSLKADVVLFICTNTFYEQNQDSFIQLSNLPEHTKYRFAWIIVGDDAKRPITHISHDIEIITSEYLFDNLSESDKNAFLSQITNYLQLVDIVIERQKKAREELRSRKRKLFNMLIPTCLAYCGIIISAISVMYFGESNQFRSSAELILILISVLTMVCMSFFGYWIISSRQRRIQQKEKSDFDKELDLSLSKSSRNGAYEDYYSELTQNIVEECATPTSNALDLIFATRKLIDLSSSKMGNGQDDPTTAEESKKRKNVSTEDIEIAKAIGDNDYIPLGHLKFNWKQMKGYYDISKHQAKTSFTWAIIISFIGISLIAFAIISPLIPIFQNQNVLIPVIGSIGGAVVELFAGTILVVYIKSLSQMNLYHKALSEYQRYLSCVNLVSKISTIEKQDQLYEEIIHEEIKKADALDSKDISYLKDLITNQNGK